MLSNEDRIKVGMGTLRKNALPIKAGAILRINVLPAVTTLLVGIKGVVDLLIHRVVGLKEAIHSVLTLITCPPLAMVHLMHRLPNVLEAMPLRVRVEDPRMVRVVLAVVVASVVQEVLVEVEVALRRYLLPRNSF
jgi:hypothetical protein